MEKLVSQGVTVNTGHELNLWITQQRAVEEDQENKKCRLIAINSTGSPDIWCKSGVVRIESPQDVSRLSL